jgi:hypothetical protein
MSEQRRHLGHRSPIQALKDRQVIGQVADQVDLGIGDLAIRFGGDHRVDQGVLGADHRALQRTGGGIARTTARRG